MTSAQLWLALLVVVIVALLAWLEQRRRDALLGGPEFRDETPAPHARPAPHLLDDLSWDEAVPTDDHSDSQQIARLQHDNRMLRELLSLTLRHIKGMEREAEIELGG